MSRARGYRRELQVRDTLAKDDWVVIRPGGSLGCADLIALRDGSRPRFIQVKSTVAGPYHSFVPAERVRLSLTARMAGALAELAWWPPHGSLHWIPESEWPR